MCEQRNVYKCQLRSAIETWLPPKEITASSARQAAEYYCNNSNLAVNLHKVRVVEPDGSVVIFELQRSWKVNSILGQIKK